MFIVKSVENKCVMKMVQKNEYALIKYVSTHTVF